MERSSCRRLRLPRVIFTHVAVIYSKKKEEGGRAGEGVEIESKRAINGLKKGEKTGEREISRKAEYWIKAIGCSERRTNIKGLYLGCRSIAVSAHGRTAAR